jgi:RNA polymerase sigma-70 factor (ECF subfamily)
VDRALRIVPAPPPGAVSDGDERLVRALQRGDPWAVAALIERHGDHVRRVLLRVLGGGDEHRDLLQEVFTRAWQGIGRLEDPRALKAWLTRIAVFVARGAIRRRQRRRWLSFFHEVPEPEVGAVASPDVEEAASCVYRILAGMPVDERIPFALRMLEEMDLPSTAAACGMSVATVRRRLARAERRFFTLARQCQALAPWMEGR